MNGDNMHKVDIKDKNIRTDLIVDREDKKIEKTTRRAYKDIKIVNSKTKDNNYTTIFFNDVTDKNSFLDVQEVLIKELSKYLNIKKDDKILVIGLGNKYATPDSLGPTTIENILVTRYLFLLGEVEEGYTNVSVYKPDVIGNTGIESIGIIKSIIKEVTPTKVVVIDALKANKLDRLTKTIQITDSGIHPGSGISNDRGEISKKTMNCEIIAIGIPTVVDINTIVESKTDIDFKNDENFIVTPTNIDFLIERLSNLLSSTLNIIFHKNTSSTNK